MRGLRVLLLGRPRIELDGQALTGLMPAKQQALVFHLAAEAAPLPRSRAAALLWGEVDEEAARANLRAALSHLRRWLPDLLAIDARQIAFASGAPVSVDLQELEAALVAGDTWPLDRRAAAAAVWRGPLLDGFEVGNGGDAFERWVSGARARAARSASALRQELAASSEAAGRHADALAHARVRLEIDDSDEPAHMELMRLLAKGGQRTAALAQYETCRAALADRLGARPSAACYALYTRIHADGGLLATALPQATPPMPVAAAAEPAQTDFTAQTSGSMGFARSAQACWPQPRSALVGRNAELALIAERLADPECRWLTITGPGGVGKTSLAVTAAAAAAAHFRHGALWLSARDDGGGLRDADGAVRQVLDRIGDDRHASGALLLVLDNLEVLPDAPALGRLLFAHAPGITVLATSRRRIAATREWLLELTGLGLGRATPDRPASSDAANLLVAVARRDLPGFDAAAEAGLVERVCARVGGLPLALEIAGRNLRTAGIAALADALDAGAGLAADPASDADARHRSIGIVLDDSWALLPPLARDAALRLAALPGPADTALAAAVGIEAEAIAALRDHSWLDLGAGSRFAMHPLQQEYLCRRPEAAVLGLGVHARLVQHLALRLPPVEAFGDLVTLSDEARALADSAAAAPPLLDQAARHLCAARELESATLLPGWIDSAVALLVARGRCAEAVALLERAGARDDLPGWRRAGWQLRRAELRIGMGFNPGAGDDFLGALEALGICGIGDETPSRCSFAGAALAVLRRKSWPREPALHRALMRLVLRNLLLLTQLLTFSPRAQGVPRAHTLSLLLARAAGGRAERIAVDVMSSYGAVFFGHFALAARLLPRPGSRPLVDDPRLRALADEGELATRIALGNWHGVVPRLDEVASRWLAIGYSRGEMECRSLAAKLAFYEGRLAEARRRFDELDALALRRPGDVWCAWARIGLAETALCLGETDLAVLHAWLDGVTALMTELENIDNAYTLRRLGLTSRVAWLVGDVNSAREAALAATASLARKPCVGFWAHEGFAGIGDGLLRLRAHEMRVGGAVLALDGAWRVFDAALGAHGARFPAGRALVQRLRGEAALARGEVPAGRRALRRAVQLAERQGLRVELARACQALATLGDGADFGIRAARLWQDMGASKA